MFLNKLKLYTIIGIIFTLITGTLMHFAYDCLGNNLIVGLISPVNESVWEHMKLIFFPMLFYSIFMNKQIKNEYPCVTSAFSFGILLGTLLIPAIFYSYTKILGYNLLILDIATFAISTLISFYTIYKLTLSCQLGKFQIPFKLIVLFFTLLFIIFSYAAPNIDIFIDPTRK